jgi:mono/diheme cytochrome c family protein
MNRFFSFCLTLLAAFAATSECLGAEQPEAGGADLATRRQRGQILYVRSCFVCHQLNGQGVPGTFPPLSGSDFIADQWKRTLRALCEGLTGEIRVNGQTFAGAMPPAMLDDQEVADVMTFVTHSWGNVPRDVTAREVSSARRKTRFKTFRQLQRASVYPPLPKAPKGFVLREVARLPIRGVRMASDGKGMVIYVLAEGGDVWRVEVASCNLRRNNDQIPVQC